MAAACELKGADPAAETLHVVSWLLDISGPHRGSKLASHGFVVAVQEIYHELEPAGPRYDPAVARIAYGMVLELFTRTLNKE